MLRQLRVPHDILFRSPQHYLFCVTPYSVVASLSFHFMLQWLKQSNQLSVDKNYLLATAANSIWIFLYFLIFYPRKVAINDQRLLFSSFLSLGLQWFSFIIIFVICLFFKSFIGSSGTSDIASTLMYFAATVLSLRFMTREFFNFHFFHSPSSRHREQSTAQEDHQATHLSDEEQQTRALIILNLEKGVPEKDLKKRYHELSQIYHPDKLELLPPQQKKTAEKEYRRIKEAYDYLSRRS